MSISHLTHEKYSALIASKRKTKKLGRRSIHDIIKNCQELSFDEKVSYIRHAYTYYEGNEDLFFDEGKRPLPFRKELNDAIISVIQLKQPASVLNSFNKQIMELRKEKLRALKTVPSLTKIKTRKDCLGENNDKPQWLKDILRINGSANKYIPIIKDYVKEVKESSELHWNDLFRLGYKQMKYQARAYFREKYNYPQK